MKKVILFLIVVTLITSCSSPKYTYNFGHYNAGKKNATTNADLFTNAAPQAIQPELLTASISNEIVLAETTSPIVETKAAAEKKTYAQMNKVERKALRTYLKAEVKNTIKAKKDNVKSTTATKGMDGDLKLAAVFGAVGIVGLIIGTGTNVFFFIGGIALIIGVVFFVKWLVRQ